MDDTYFGTTPRPLASAPSEGTHNARDEEHGQRAMPRRSATKRSRTPRPKAKRTDFAFVTALATPGFIASIAAIPVLHGYEAAGVGIAALFFGYLPVGAWIAPDGHQNSTAERVGLGVGSIALAAAVTSAARHVEGSRQLGLFFAALLLAVLALAFQIDTSELRQAAADVPVASELKPSEATRRVFRPAVVLVTLVLATVAIVVATGLAIARFG